MADVIVNADDLGMTPGTNAAIFDAYDRGVLTHASIMANGACFDEAVEGLKQRPGLGCGIHLNLSYGRSLSGQPALCDEDGTFKYGFVALMLRAMGDRTILDAIGEELEAQVCRVREAGIPVTHLDSHRHIHLIPPIYKTTVALAEKYGIGRVRLIRENIADSIRFGGVEGVFLNGGVVKYLLLGSFSLFNRLHADRSGRRFYSILHTGGVTREALEKILGSGLSYEVMIHPGYPDMDAEAEIFDPGERAYRISKRRRSELEALLEAGMKRKGCR